MKVAIKFRIDIHRELDQNKFQRAVSILNPFILNHVYASSIAYMTKMHPSYFGFNSLFQQALHNTILHTGNHVFRLSILL